MKSIPTITPTIMYRIVSPSVFVEFSELGLSSSVSELSSPVITVPSVEEHGYVPVGVGVFVIF